MGYEHVPVRRGPAAGRFVSARGGLHIWLDRDGRARHEAAEGFGLYRWAQGAWEFAGDRERRCGCGAIVPCGDACGLCGDH